MKSDAGRQEKLLPGVRLKAALALAIAADIFQLVLYPLMIEGAASPADDAIDLGIAGAMAALLGWHWEFMPSFFGKLAPGLDMVPLWTLAVASVYRRQKSLAHAQATMNQADLPGPQNDPKSPAA